MKRYFPYDKRDLLITPEVAKWQYSGLAVFARPAGALEISTSLTEKNESALIPLRGRDIQVVIDGERFNLNGRDGVFEGATDWIYVAPGSNVQIESNSEFEVAFATAKAEKKFPTAYVAKSDLVETRGSSSATREIRPFMHPDNFPNAVKLNAVEVITPDGNTSSYPPHRHDGIGDCPFHNEEIYYFRIGEIGGAHGSPAGFGFHRTYSAPEDSVSFDDSVTVKDGDIYLVDRGYHGPCTAMPGYPMYYLNVLAGPNSDRNMGFCDDPTYAHIREDWKTQTTDARVPWRVSR